MKQFLIIVLFNLLLSGCAQKLPIYHGEEVGLLAIPMKTINHENSRIVYYYELSSTEEKDVKIKLEPVVGRDFAFSEPLPAGEHAFDILTMYATPYNNTMVSMNKQVKALYPPVTFKIEAGSINLANDLLEVEHQSIDNREFQQTAQCRRLGRDEWDEYADKLKKMENASGWKITLSE